MYTYTYTLYIVFKTKISNIKYNIDLLYIIYIYISN